MDLNIVISSIAMVATVISTVIAILQAKKCKDIKEELIVIKNESYNMVDKHKMKTEISNHGTNSGVIAKEVRGGVTLGK